MWSENQAAVSVVLSGVPTEVIKKSHGLEYKFIHPQTVMAAFLSLNLQKKNKISENF